MADELSKAYAIQERDEARRLQAGATAAGYKIACTNLAAQAFVGVSEPCYARLFSTDRIADAGHIDVAPDWPCGIECELAVIFSQDLPPDGDISGAIGWIAIAIEIVEDRYGGISKAGAPVVVAGRFAHRAFILGDRQAYRGQALDTYAADILLDGRIIDQNVSSNVLGDPLNALRWLQKALADRGRHIKAGDMILTGSIAPTYWVRNLPATFVCSLSGGLGRLSVSLAAAPASG